MAKCNISIIKKYFHIRSPCFFLLQIMAKTKSVDREYTIQKKAACSWLLHKSMITYQKSNFDKGLAVKIGLGL